MRKPTGRPTGRPPQELMPRFWSKVDKRGPEECWPWLGAFLPSGYGAFWLGKNNSTAHRAAYRLLVGDVPPGLVIRHSCDHKWCVNPAHLAPGTQAQNIADKVHRDRQARGSGHGMSTVPEDTARRIKAALALGHRQTSIAFCAGVTKYVVYDIKHGRTWRHLE